MKSKLTWGITELYLFSFGIMLFFYGFKQIDVFANNSIIEWGNRAAQVLAYIILIFIILTRNMNTKWMKYIIIIGIVLVISLESTHSTGLLRYGMLILAGRNIPYKKVLRMMLGVYGTIFVSSCLLFIIGISDSGMTRREGVGLGFVHPNVASLIFTTIILLWVCLQKKYTHKTDLVIIISALLIWFVTKTKVMAICLMAYSFLYRIIRRNCNKNIVLVKKLLEGTQLFVFGISVALVLAYPLSIYDSLRTRVDLLLSYRPYLNYNNIMKYGISLWGQNVSIYNTTEYAYNYFGGFVSNQKFNTVDNAYILGLITTGIIPLAMMFICFIAVINKAWKIKNYSIIVAAVIFAMYSFVENAANEGFIMFPYFYLVLADDHSYQQVKEKSMSIKQIRLKTL